MRKSEPILSPKKITPAASPALMLSKRDWGGWVPGLCGVGLGKKLWIGDQVNTYYEYITRIPAFCAVVRALASATERHNTIVVDKIIVRISSESDEIGEKR